MIPYIDEQKGSFGSRADLPDAVGRPIQLLRGEDSPALGADRSRRGADRHARPDPPGELQGVRRAQGVADPPAPRDPGRA
jgi:hypothetical protein